MNKKIYAIYDTMAQAITGPLWTFGHDAAAIRTFNDLASDNRTEIAKHPADYNLILLGELVDETTILPHSETILEGSQWLALNQKSTQTE